MISNETSYDIMSQYNEKFYSFNLISCFNGSSKITGIKNTDGQASTGICFRAKSCLLYVFLLGMFEKLNKFFFSAHSYLIGPLKSKECSCSGKVGECRYNLKRLDPNDYFHALKNTHINVPECSEEPYIHSGYMLPHQQWSYYFKVLWIPNNEAINVWTHLIPAFYFIWLFFDFAQEIDLLHAWPLLFVTAGAIAITACSSIAHMFHSRSNYHHCCLFMVDYFGISLYAFSSTTAHFFAGSELSYYSLIGWANLIVFVIIAAIGFYFCSFSQTGRKNSNTHHRQFKLWANGLGYFYGVIPIMCRIATSSGRDDALHFYICHILCMSASPLLYASDFPQKYWPGKFDIIGHSHQVFHVLIALGCYCDIRAISIDLSSHRWFELRAQTDYPNIEIASIAVLILSVYCFLVGSYFSRQMKRCFQSEVEAMSRNPLTSEACQICNDSQNKKLR